MRLWNPPRQRGTQIGLTDSSRGGRSCPRGLDSFPAFIHDHGPSEGLLTPPAPSLWVREQSLGVSVSCEENWKVPFTKVRDLTQVGAHRPKPVAC